MLLCSIITMDSLHGQVVNTGELIIGPDAIVGLVSDFGNSSTGSLMNHGKIHVYGNWNNDGVVDFFLDMGQTHFQGTDAQIISGSNPGFFYDVLFNNTTPGSAFLLDGDMNVIHQCSFMAGIVDNTNTGGTFVFGTNADHDSASGNSHVNGPVTKEGNSAFVFPIGDGGNFTPVTTSALQNSEDVIAVQFIYADPGGVHPRNRIAGSVELLDGQLGYWLLVRELGNSAVQVTFSLDGIFAIPPPIAPSIRILRWDDQEELWVNQGGTADLSNNTITVDLPSDILDGVFTLGIISGDRGFVFPGDVTVFNAISANGDGVNDFFRIENVENMPNNRVEIFNRWGIKVFETTDYGANGNVFDGRSDGRLMIDTGLLPVGTYFYVLSYDYENNGEVQRIKKAGYLFLTTN